MTLWRLENKPLASELKSEALKAGSLGIELPVGIANEDNDLVRDFIAGNDAAFTQLVTKYKDALTNYINMMVGNYDTAIDLSQETFLRVYKNILRYSNIYQFSTWIYRIATNLAIDEMRFRKGRGRVFHKNIWGSRTSEGQEGAELQLPDKRMGPRDEMLRKESRQVLEDAIRSLPEKYRTAFILKEIQEMPYESIAQVLKCSTGTIKSRLHRARELLQRKLEHYM